VWDGGALVSSEDGDFFIGFDGATAQVSWVAVAAGL